MRRRPLALVLTAALIGAVFTALPARAATEIPATVQIEDPVGDANTTNGDNVTPAGSVSNVGDLLKVWFSSAEGKVSVHFLTAVTPPASNYGMQFTVAGSPGSDGANCLIIRGIVPGSAPGGGAFQGSPIAKVFDACKDGSNFFDNGKEGEITVEALEDGSGITTLTFDPAYSTLLSTGSVISKPAARTDIAVGKGDTVFQTLRADDTKVGTDYTIAEGDVEPPVIDEPEPPKPPKNPCKKLEGKKKKQCLKKLKGSATFVPGEQGAGAETVVVKDENTADAPLEITVTQEAGQGNDQVDGSVYDGTAHAFRNLQVDSAAAEAGLYIRYEFPTQEDHDLYLNYADGTEAAHSGGFNPAPEGPFDGTGAGGHSEQGSENIDGVRTADCAGYTVDFTNFIGEGGDYTVKVWLGEIKNDPAAPAAKALVF